MSRYLDPKSDVVFKKIFGQKPHLLKSFLNALLPLPEGGLIESLEYLSSEHVPSIPEFKYSVVDVKCTDQSGRIFIVEMQIQWAPSFMQRMLFASSKAYVNQLDKGEDYKLLNPVYGLGLLGSNFDHDSSDYYHHYKIVNVKKPEREIKGLQLVFVELLKFKPKSFSEKKLQALWLRFMSEINENCREIEPELLCVPEIKEAIELTQESAFSPAELETYEKYWDAVSREKSIYYGRFEEGFDNGFDQGIEHGIKRGIEQGIETGKQAGDYKARLEIAGSLMSAGIPIDQVAQITHLPRSLLEKIDFKNLEHQS